MRPSPDSKLRETVGWPATEALGLDTDGQRRPRLSRQVHVDGGYVVAQQRSKLAVLSAAGVA
jgi:hypothetical protein